MKTLEDFKRKIKNAIETDSYIDFVFHSEIQYLDHPFKDWYPEGLKVSHKVYENSKFGRLLSKQFTRVYEEGGKTHESWLEFGPAGSWTFPDENTATRTLSEDFKPQWSGSTTLTYRFK